MTDTLLVYAKVYRRKLDLEFQDSNKRGRVTWIYNILDSEVEELDKCEEYTVIQK